MLIFICYPVYRIGAPEIRLIIVKLCYDITVSQNLD